MINFATGLVGTKFAVRRRPVLTSGTFPVAEFGSSVAVPKGSRNLSLSAPYGRVRPGCRRRLQFDGLKPDARTDQPRGRGPGLPHDRLPSHLDRLRSAHRVWRATGFRYGDPVSRELALRRCRSLGNVPFGSAASIEQLEFSATKKPRLLRGSGAENRTSSPESD